MITSSVCLPDLIRIRDRLKKVERGNPELDAALFCACPTMGNASDRHRVSENNPCKVITHYASGTWGTWSPSRATWKLDDALRFFREALGDYDYILTRANDGLTIQFNAGDLATEFGETAPLAVVIGTLSAIIKDVENRLQAAS